MSYKFLKDEHVHTLDGKPLVGTSSMASVLAKPLTYWAAGLAVEKFGWTNKGNPKSGWTPKQKRLETAGSRRREIAELTDEQYLLLLDDAYTAHATKLKTSAEAGTDLHEVMESYVKECIETNNGVPLGHAVGEDAKLSIFVDWALKNVKRFLWSEAHCYSRELWLGGITDCGFEDHNGEYAVLDFKSSKDVYLSQFWQCVAYAIQIEENGLYNPDGDLIMELDKPISYVAVLPFGMEKPEVKTNVDMSGGKKCVECMVHLYKALN